MKIKKKTRYTHIYFIFQERKKNLINNEKNRSRAKKKKRIEKDVVGRMKEGKKKERTIRLGINREIKAVQEFREEKETMKIDSIFWIIDRRSIAGRIENKKQSNK